jgi:hypothetical protein
MAIVVSPDGLLENDGTATSPWPLEKGLQELANGEDVLLLRGGSYVRRVVIREVIGTSAQPKVISSYPGERAVIDGTLEDFREVPNDLWKPGSGIDSDEYISVSPYEHDDNNAARGSFLDRNSHIRLITHQFLEDLQSENERCGHLPRDQVVDGPEPAPDVEGTPGADEKTRRPFVYMGPGLHQDDEGFIHVRLSPTHNNLAGFPDYDGPSDPGSVSLAIWTSVVATLKIVKCRSLQLCDITVRHGTTTVVVEDCTDVRLDHVEVFAGNAGIELRGCSGTVLTHCLFDGGLPPWHFRSDRKDEFLLASDTDGRPHAPGENTMKALLGGRENCQATTISFCEFVNGHDNFLFGSGVEFSRNWVKNMNDDAIVIDTENAADHRIFGNVIEQCQVAISSGGKVVAGGGTLVFRNLIDLRRPFAKNRPRPVGAVDGKGLPLPDPQFNAGDILATGVLYKSNEPDGPLAIFQNTIVLKDQESRESFAFFRGYEGPAPLRSYNNIFVSVNTVPGSDRPIFFLPDPDLPLAETNGNAYHRAGQYIDGPLLRRRLPLKVFPSLADWHSSTEFHDSELTHPPGYEHDAIESFPMFRRFNPTQAGPAGADDMRVAGDSPALRAGVVLADDLRQADGAPTDERPDMGFLPYGSPPLAVGVDARRTFPHTEPPPAVPD